MIHVVFSGGLDSTTALAQVVHEGGKARALFFEYGQRHGGERQAARAVAERLGVELREINLEGFLHSRSLLASSEEEVPRASYDKENIRSTEVLGRNLLFASHAVAQAQRGDSLVLGVHGGDHDLYPDCRPEFWQNFKNLSAAYGIETRTPFLKLTKAGIVEIANVVGAPLELSWSCYNSGELQCGKCATCLERREAFQEAGIPDPTRYGNEV